MAAIPWIEVVRDGGNIRRQATITLAAGESEQYTIGSIERKSLLITVHEHPATGATLRVYSTGAPEAEIDTTTDWVQSDNGDITAAAAEQITQNIMGLKFSAATAGGVFNLVA